MSPIPAAFVLANGSTTMAYGGMPPVKMGALSYVPHPQVMQANGSGITACREDSLAAYTHALLYFIKQDPRHAEKAIEIMDAWTAVDQPPIALVNGLQVAWGAAVWPRAAEIIRHTYTAKPWAGAAAWGEWMMRVFVPVVDEGASTNGNIGLVMTEAAAAIAVYTDNETLWNQSITMWRAQAPAYVYITSDGPSPARPPQERYLQNTGPICEPNCNDKQMVNYWHGQKDFGTGVADGICQESCRDAAHVTLGYATLVNTAETAFHQGIDIYAEEERRLIAGAELHASLLLDEPAPHRQPVPQWLCGGFIKGVNTDLNGWGHKGGTLSPVNATTWSMVHHHYVTRMGALMPNVSAILPCVYIYNDDSSMEK